MSSTFMSLGNSAVDMIQIVHVWISVCASLCLRFPFSPLVDVKGEGEGRGKEEMQEELEEDEKWGQTHNVSYFQN